MNNHHYTSQHAQLLRELREHAADIADKHQLTGADRITLQQAAANAYNLGADIEATLASTRRMAQGMANTAALQVAA